MGVILPLLGLGLICLLAVVLFRTLRLVSKQVDVGPPAVLELVEGELAQRLARALQFRTVSYGDPDRFKGDEFVALHEYLIQSFPRAHAALEREVVDEYSLLYRWPGREQGLKPVLLMAHLDVVPADAAGDGWVCDPFEGRIDEGYIWGRGALDDKNVVVGLLEAVEALLRDGFQPRRTIYLAFGHDEEVGGRGAAATAELLRSRGVELEFVLDEGLSITEGIAPGVSKPVAMVGVTEKGYLSVELTVAGVGGHAMMPPPQTAVGVLAAAISKLERYQFPTKLQEPVRSMLDVLASEMSFAMRAVFANSWLFGGLVRRRLSASPASNALIRTTTAPTVFAAGVKENVLADHARAVVNFRLLHSESLDSVLEHVRHVVDDPRVNLKVMEGFRSDPSPISDIASPGFKVVERTIHQVFERVLVSPGLVIGGTDSRLYVQLTDCILRFSPIWTKSEDLNRIHGCDERISIENYAQLVRFYAQLVRNSDEV